MSNLYANARMWVSRLLVIFQHFFLRVGLPGCAVHCCVCRMSATMLGDWIEWPVRDCVDLVVHQLLRGDRLASSCSRRRRRGLLGITLLACSSQNAVPGGGGIWVVHRVACGSSWAEAAARRSGGCLVACVSRVAPLTQTVVTGASSRDCIQLRRWSQRKASSGKLVGSRGRRCDIVHHVGRGLGVSRCGSSPVGPRME